jgi:hypothetical protein
VDPSEEEAAPAAALRWAAKPLEVVSSRAAGPVGCRRGDSRSMLACLAAFGAFRRSLASLDRAGTRLRD